MTTTPNLAEVIKTGVESALKEVHTAMPAVVVSYDKTTGYATVQPALQRTYVDGRIVDLPRIVNVPVGHLRAAGGSAFVHMPVAKDDSVLLIFCERSIEKWKKSGGVVDPQNNRRHNLSDAFAMPCGYSKDKTFPGDVAGDAITIGVGDSRFVVGADGAFTLKNATGELLTKLLEAIDELVEKSKVATSMGLQPLIPTPAYVVKRAALDEFVGGD